MFNLVQPKNREKAPQPEGTVTPYIEHLCLLHGLGSDLRVPTAHTLPGLSALGERSLREGTQCPEGQFLQIPRQLFSSF